MEASKKGKITKKLEVIVVLSDKEGLEWDRVYMKIIRMIRGIMDIRGTRFIWGVRVRTGCDRTYFLQEVKRRERTFAAYVNAQATQDVRDIIQLCDVLWSEGMYFKVSREYPARDDLYPHSNKKSGRSTLEAKKFHLQIKTKRVTEVVAIAKKRKGDILDMRYIVKCVTRVNIVQHLYTFTSRLEL